MAQRQWRSDDTDKWVYGFGDGSDGNLTISSNTTYAPIDSSCSGTSGTTSLSATNASFATGQIILIHQSRGTGVGGWELNKIAGYTAGTITTSHALTMTYTDSGASQAQVLVLKQYNNVTINSSTLMTKAWDGNIGGITAFLAKETVSGSTGIISAAGGNGGNDSSVGTGGGYRGGAGVRNSGTTGQAGSGEGTSGASSLQYTTNGNGGGGAKGDDKWGGGGGNGTVGSNGSSVGGGGTSFGYGGSTSGTASLVTATFGGGGGGGSDYQNETSGAGGSGGGIVFIFGKNIDLTGLSINLKGGNGQVGAANATGGSGAGGSCLLKSTIATLGTNKIDASANTAGADGGVGRIHLDYSGSYTGTTTPTVDATNDLTIVEPASGAFFQMF